MSYLGVGSGIGAGGELTSSEELFVQNIASLSYVKGDLLYFDGMNIVKLGIGSASQILQVSSGIPNWTTLSTDNLTGFATSTASFIVVSSDTTLANERLLTGTANQITVTDNGAGATVTLSLPQSIGTASSVTFGDLTIGTLSGVLKATSGVVAIVPTPVKNYALLYNGTAPVWAAQGTSFTFAIATFTCDFGASGTYVEMGVAGTWKAIGALSFSATYTNGPATSGSVAHSGWVGSLTMGGVGYIGPTTNTEAVAYPAIDGNRQFTLTASDGTDSPTSTITYYFFNRRYWGTSTTAAGYTEANVEGLTGGDYDLNNTRAKSFTVNAADTYYIIYAYPSRMGTATFTVGGFEGGFGSPETVSVTNPTGYAENYYVYRSTNEGLGSTTVVVS